ncbi:PulJ/GspJ family protein [Pseudoduganella aquatica]|uniref:Prepilin-type N-terminal cleavage/methylation domain-containing protein n=1 Tax=Pseudoduganella aquatica TaxID=2660641 RepID=A0A7X4HFE7_9BURK|nr:prepilin-type N-terminal cleavage/methylation domain-containing protein [Pseudoduganella aquatica]MYN10266.1 prepilin-type N-terminal cleavage/methylation domain-containing protein [Pseudoduganella aquatica]
MAPAYPLRRARGFTLIELLVAVAVLAIVAVLGWRGLDGIVRSRQALTEQMEQTRGIQLALAQLQSDMEHRAVRKQLRSRETLAADSDRMIFVRTVLAESEPSRLQVVTYRIRDGVLTRRESRAVRDLLQLDALWAAAISDSDATPGVALQSGVESMAVRGWRDGGWQAVTGVQSSQEQKAAANTAVQDLDGLELSLQLQGQAGPLVKAFLMGEK